MDLKEETALGRAIDDHWYYVSKAQLIESHISGRGLRILDVGAGSGWFSRWLLKRGIAAEAVCVDPGYTHNRDEIVHERQLAFRQSAGDADGDLILLMDVLEHVDNDVALLSHYMHRASPDTQFLITVPAFQWLWSAHDDYLGHRRRYTITSLSKVVQAAGGKEIAAHYYFAAILPLAASVRMLRRFRKADRSDMRPAPVWLNKLLTTMLSLERKWMRVNKFAGLSVVLLCRK